MTTEVITFGPELRGTGWYYTEWMQEEGQKVDPFRWMPSAENTATVEFIGYNWQNVTLSCKIINIIHPSVLVGMKVSIDDKPALFSMDSAKPPYAMTISGKRNHTKQISTLKFEFANLKKPSEVLPDNADQRAMAMAFGRIEVRPAKLSFQGNHLQSLRLQSGDSDED